jgi:hypothetical protein
MQQSLNINTTIHISTSSAPLTFLAAATHLLLVHGLLEPAVWLHHAGCMTAPKEIVHLEWCKSGARVVNDLVPLSHLTHSCST